MSTEIMSLRNIERKIIVEKMSESQTKAGNQKKFENLKI